MASLILTQTLGKSFGQIGQAIGALIGSQIDNAAINAINGTQKEPSRLSSLKLMSSVDGAPMPKVFGRARIGGHIIWASNFKETQIKRRVGGKTGPKISTNVYSISFAIGLCEGQITGIGKVWANGNLFDISQTEYRLYTGAENQDIDPLIEAEIGYGNCPRFNNTAYIVFEDLKLEDFGDRIPQLSFEVFASSQTQDSIENLVKGVCLIPASGEFSYATTINREIILAGKERLINQNQSQQVSDFVCSIENLVRELPNSKSISLVASWFGSDLRSGNCTIAPRVERLQKTTLPDVWNVAGVSRQNAQLVSQINGMPAYGGSINDKSIIEAISHLNSNNFSVSFNPFIMMDIPSGNNLEGLEGGFQPAYPWRGRIGFSNSQLGTSVVRTSINAFYGNALAAHFSVNNGQVYYNGPNEWTYSRFVLHMASLCKAAGGVDAFLIGSEMVGLTHANDETGAFPFVDKLVHLSGQVRTILGANCKISYAADWTEYGAFYRNGNTYFPLDRLWADNNVDFIGIDYYAPLSDRRDNTPLNEAIINANIEGGEAFDYYYQSENDRISSIKTPIIDTAYNEPWVYRQKDIRGFWSNTHYERVNGVKKSDSTPWIAKSKPIRFMEFGVGAIDKGANRPSAFPDAKSSENTVPPFSNNMRDDYEQSIAIRSFLKYWNNNNPNSNLYNGKMLDTEKTHLWAWDARPYPAFPSLNEVWGDYGNYEKGHWLMGRTNVSNISQIFEWALKRSGIEAYDCSKISGLLDGYVIEDSNARDMLEGLMIGFNISYKNENGIAVFSNAPKNMVELKSDELIFKESSKSEILEIETAITDVQLSLLSANKDYEIANYFQVNNGGRKHDFSLPIIAGDNISRMLLQNLSNYLNAPQQTIETAIPPSHGLEIEIGDLVKLEGIEYEVQSIDWGNSIELNLIRHNPAFENAVQLSQGNILNPPKAFSKPILFALDLPFPFSTFSGAKPSFYICQEPFCAPISLEFQGEIIAQATNGAVLASALNLLPDSKVSQKLNLELEIELVFGETLPQSGNFALVNNGEIQDIFSFESRELIGTKKYKIGGIVRGLNGVAKAPEIALGSQLILLEIGRVDFDLPLQYQNLEMPIKLLSANLNPQIEYDYSFIYAANVKKPWSVCHLKAKRGQNNISISFIPRALGEFDNWEIEQSLMNRVFGISIRNSAQTIVHNGQTTSNVYEYQNEIADFGTQQNAIDVEIWEIGENGKIGYKSRNLIAIEAL